MHRTNTTILTIGLMTLGGLAFSPAALATTVVQTGTDVVSYSDLNLGKRADDRVLLKRIEHAAVKACGGYPSGPDLDVYLRFNACEARAMNDAVHALNNVAVSQLYDRETRTRAG